MRGFIFRFISCFVLFLCSTLGKFSVFLCVLYKYIGFGVYRGQVLEIFSHNLLQSLLFLQLEVPPSGGYKVSKTISANTQKYRFPGRSNNEMCDTQRETKM